MGGDEATALTVIFGDKDTVKPFSVALQRKGIYVSFIDAPAVPKDLPRLRTVALGCHSEETIQKVLGIFNEVLKNFPKMNVW